MSIPNDPLNRWWLELADDNPDEVAKWRHSLVSFVAYDHSRIANLVGTGFLIGGSKDFGIVLTAAHVLNSLTSYQKPAKSHAPSALFTLPSQQRPSIHPSKLKVLWGGNDGGGAFDVIHMEYNESTDIGCCVFAHQPEAERQPFDPGAIAIDISDPRVGDVVIMGSQSHLQLTELAPPQRSDGYGQYLEIHRKVSLRMGVVTGVYPQGLRQYKWPCFTTSIPADPGMSGGAVSIWRAGKAVAACGVVSADISPPEAKLDYCTAGESIVCSTWAALGLRIPLTIPVQPETQIPNLLEMIRAGMLPNLEGDISRIRISGGDNGDYTIQRLP